MSDLKSGRHMHDALMVSTDEGELLFMAKPVRGSPSTNTLLCMALSVTKENVILNPHEVMRLVTYLQEWFARLPKSVRESPWTGD